MKKFKYNKYGVCENPNIIFRTTSKNIKANYPEQTPQSFTISTARSLSKKEQWCYGYVICGRDFYQSSPCSFYSEGKFENEKSAIMKAIVCIKKCMDYHTKHNTDVTPAYDPALKRMLAECRLDVMQLTLF